MNDAYVGSIQKERKRRKKYLVIFLAFFACYVLALGASWIVIRSPLLLVTHITFAGNEQVPNQSILDALRARAFVDTWGPFKTFLGFINMLTWPDRLDVQGLALLPEVKSITVAKDYGARTLVITTEERKPYAIWCDKASAGDGAASDAPPGDCAWFDDAGVLFERAAGAQGSLIFTVNDYSQHDLRMGANVLPAQFLPDLFSIFHVLQRGGVNIAEIRLNDLALQELEVRTYSGLPAGQAGPKMYFSLRFPADNDLAAIQDLAAKPGYAKLHYLDFRVENRVYYK